MEAWRHAEADTRPHVSSSSILCGYIWGVSFSLDTTRRTIAKEMHSFREFSGLILNGRLRMTREIAFG